MASPELKPLVSRASSFIWARRFRFPQINTGRSMGALPLQFPRDELLDAVARDIIRNLARRMLHRVGSNRKQRTANLAVARELEASNCVDHDAARIRRVLHRHPQLELDRDTRETLALDPQEADLVVVLPWHVVGRPDMDIDVG